jgi:hypothetical protein
MFATILRARVGVVDNKENHVYPCYFKLRRKRLFVVCSLSTTHDLATMWHNYAFLLSERGGRRIKNLNALLIPP